MTEPYRITQQTPKQGMLDIQLSFPDPQVVSPPSLDFIIKRDNRIEAFDAAKISDAIFQAATSIGGEDENLARSLASSVTLYLSKRGASEPLHVNHVDAAVERVLVEMGHERTALAYVQHRNKHLQMKELRNGNTRTVRDALAAWRWSRRVPEPDSSAETHISHQLEYFGIGATQGQELKQELVTALMALGLNDPSVELVRALTHSVLQQRGLIGEGVTPAQLHLDLAAVEASFVGPFQSADILSTPNSTDRVLAACAKESYALTTLFSADIANAHSRGDLHIHELGSIDRLHSIALHPDYIKRFGPLSNLARTNISPARKIETIIEDIATSTQILTRYCTDSIQWEAINYSLAPYLVEFDDQSLHEVSELLILSLMGQHEGAAPCTTKVDIAWEVPFYLQGIEAIGPNGAMTGKYYESFQKTAQDFAHSLLQVFREVAEKFDTINLPIPVVTLPAASHIDASSLAYANKVALCALILDDLEIQSEHELPLLPFHDETLQPRSIFAQFATLNLARLGFSAHEGEDFWQSLDRLFDIVSLAFTEKKDFLLSLTQRKSIGSYSHFSLRHEGKPFADLSTAEFGVALCGLDECIRALRQTPEFSHLGYEQLGGDILDRLRALCADASEQRSLRISLQAFEDASIAERFTRIDMAHFDAGLRAGMTSTATSQYSFATSIGAPSAAGSYKTFEQHVSASLRYQEWMHGAVSLKRPDPDVTFPEQLSHTLNHFFQQQPRVSLHLHR